MRGTRKLWFAGLLMVLPSLYFVLRYPLIGNIKLTDMGWMSGHSQQGLWEFLLVITCMFLVYSYAIITCTHVDNYSARYPVFICGVALVIIFAFMYPTTAIDVFVYAARSRVFTHYGADPMTTPANKFFFDHFVRFAQQYGDNISVYGPLWNLLAAPITVLSGESMGKAIVGFKLLAVLSTIASAILIYLVLREISPQGASLGVLLFLWNPLVLWEIPGNGHNDLVFLIFVLLAILAWQRGFGFVSPALLLAGAMVKYVPFIMLPIFLVAIGSQSLSKSLDLRKILFGVVSCCVVLLISFWPFYNPWAIYESIREQDRIMLVSPASALINFLSGGKVDQDIASWVKLTGRGIFLIVLLILLWVVWKSPKFLPFAVFECLFMYLILAAWSVQNWYGVWLVAIAALINGWHRARAISMSIGMLYVYGLFIWVRYLWIQDGIELLYWGVLMIFLLPVAFTLVQYGLRIFLDKRPSAKGEAATSLVSISS